jgi:hypothetical protein
MIAKSGPADTATVTIDYDGTAVAVDIGFIVYNETNYPDLTALFTHLGVETVESCMSFAVTLAALNGKAAEETGVKPRKVCLRRLETCCHQDRGGNPMGGVAALAQGCASGASPRRRPGGHRPEYWREYYLGGGRTQ